MTATLRWTLAFTASVSLALVATDADAARRKPKREPSEPAARTREAAARIDLSTADGAVQAMRRIWCAGADGAPTYWRWRGEVWSRRQGEKDRLLFKVEGLNVRTCVATQDPVRGQGVRTLSRELLLYLDPQTGQPLTQWKNPWTDETVDVVHIANDPVNGEFYARTADGQPAQWRGITMGDQWFLNTTAPLFYANPLGGPFQSEIGGAYHATEMFNFSGETDDLVSGKGAGAGVRVSWVRIADWLPWMKMGGREGLVYMNTAGRKVARWEDLSPMLRQQVERNYPLFRAPPPMDDRRPNETSLTAYRKLREGAAPQAGGTQ